MIIDAALRSKATHAMVLFGMVLEAMGCSGQSTGTGAAADGTAAPAAVEALFGAPQGAVTPDSVFGAWGGTITDATSSVEVRTRLEPTTMTTAARCRLSDGRTGARTVFAVTSARVSEQSMASLEAKSDDIDTNGVRCGVKVATREIPRCVASQTEAFRRMCFDVKGTTLTQYGETGLDKMELTKLSD
jgi:hypothetical protein